MYRLLDNIEIESHCKRNNIGALLTDEKLESILAFGYNGNVRGGPNTCDSDEVGRCGCIHAETNALVKERAANPSVIFISESPCLMCAKLIINVGTVKYVFYSRLYRDSGPSLELLARNKIETFDRANIHFHIIGD